MCHVAGAWPWEGRAALQDLAFWILRLDFKTKGKWGFFLGRPPPSDLPGEEDRSWAGFRPFWVSWPSHDQLWPTPPLFLTPTVSIRSSASCWEQGVGVSSVKGGRSISVWHITVVWCCLSRGQLQSSCQPPFSNLYRKRPFAGKSLCLPRNNILISATLTTQSTRLCSERPVPGAHALPTARLIL